MNEKKKINKGKNKKEPERYILFNCRNLHLYLLREAFLLKYYFRLSSSLSIDNSTGKKK